MKTLTRHTLPLPEAGVHRPAATLSYLLGEGDTPVLLMHGFTGTALRHLGEVIERLSPHYRIIAPDLRGYGASRPPNRDFPVGFYPRDAADMAFLLATLACGPALVLGFSDGAESALLLAASRPDLVAGVVSWGVSGVISPDHVTAVNPWLPVDAWGPDRATWREEIIADHGPEQLEPMIRGWVEAARAIALAGGNICLEEAAQIQCPVLLINGEGEVGNLPEDVMLLAQQIPDCRLVFVPDAGHWVHTDQPEVFLELVESFLRSVLAARTGRQDQTTAA